MHRLHGDAPPPTLKRISVWVQAGEGPQWLDSMGQALKDFLDDLRSGAACAPGPLSSSFFSHC
jgi:hypothetical protein